MTSPASRTLRAALAGGLRSSSPRQTSKRFATSFAVVWPTAFACFPRAPTPGSSARRWRRRDSDGGADERAAALIGGDRRRELDGDGQRRNPLVRAQRGRRGVRPPTSRRPRRRSSDRRDDRHQHRRQPGAPLRADAPLRAGGRGGRRRRRHVGVRVPRSVAQGQPRPRRDAARRRVRWGARCDHRSGRRPRCPPPLVGRRGGWRSTTPVVSSSCSACSTGAAQVR